ncbi:hypothetical protein AAY473_016684 [Plecturocebus cupreus]
MEPNFHQNQGRNYISRNRLRLGEEEAEFIKIAFRVSHGYYPYWIGAHPNDFILTWFSAKTLFPNKVTFCNASDEDLNLSLFGERHIMPQCPLRKQSKDQAEGPRTMVPTCNPSTLEGQGGLIAWAQEFKTFLDNMLRACLCIKYKNHAGVVAHNSSPNYSEA